jgi:hypothetical protein
MEEQPPAMEGSCEFTEEEATDDKGWSSSLGVGRGANKPSLYKIYWLRKQHRSLGPGWIIWINDPRDGIWIKDSDFECKEFTYSGLPNDSFKETIAI